MAQKNKFDAYEDSNYNKKEEIYDAIMQCIQDIKFDNCNPGGPWNMPVDKIQGMTARLVGNDQLAMTCHHYETTTTEQLAVDADTDKQTIKEFVKELKKVFRKMTKKTLNLKEVSSDRTIEKTAGFRADRCWTPDSQLGKYLIRDVIVYEFDCELLK